MVVTQSCERHKHQLYSRCRSASCTLPVPFVAFVCIYDLFIGKNYRICIVDIRLPAQMVMEFICFHFMWTTLYFRTAGLCSVGVAAEYERTIDTRKRCHDGLRV